MLVPIEKLNLAINTGILLKDEDFHKFHGWICPLKRIKVKLNNHEIKTVINYISYTNENINNNLKTYIEIFYEYFDKPLHHYTDENNLDRYFIDISEEELFYLRLTELFPKLKGVL